MLSMDHAFLTLLLLTAATGLLSNLEMS